MSQTLLRAQLQAAQASLEAASIAIDTALAALGVGESDLSDLDPVTTPGDLECTHEGALPAAVMGHPNQKKCPDCGLEF